MTRPLEQAALARDLARSPGLCVCRPWIIIIVVIRGQDEVDEALAIGVIGGEQLDERGSGGLNIGHGQIDADAGRPVQREDLGTRYRLRGMAARSAFHITDTVRDVLARSTITATSLTLPEQLDRKTYDAVNKALSGAGGRWDRKAKAHVFNRDPREVLGLAVETGKATNVRTKLQAFYTPARRQRAPPTRRFLSIAGSSRVMRTSSRAAVRR